MLNVLDFLNIFVFCSQMKCGLLGIYCKGQINKKNGSMVGHPSFEAILIWVQNYHLAIFHSVWMGHLVFYSMQLIATRMCVTIIWAVV